MADDDRTAMEKYFDRDGTPDDPTDESGNTESASASTGTIDDTSASPNQAERRDISRGGRPDASAGDTTEESGKTDTSSSDGNSPGPSERQDIRDGMQPDVSREESDSSTSTPTGGTDDTSTSPSPTERENLVKGNDPSREETVGPDEGFESSSSDSESGSTRTNQEDGRQVVVEEGAGDISNAITPEQLTQIDEQTDADVTAEDLVFRDGELQYSREFQREQAANQINEQIASNSPLQSPGVSQEDVVRADEGGFRLRDSSTEELQGRLNETVPASIADLPLAAEREIKFNQRNRSITDQSEAADIPEGIRDNVQSVTREEVDQTLQSNQEREAVENKDAFSSDDEELSAVPEAGEEKSDAQQRAEEQLSAELQAQQNGRVDNVIKSRVPEDDILAGQSQGVRDFGRTLLGEQEPDSEITGKLTEGEGNAPFTLTEEERAEVGEDIEQRQDFFGVGDEAESFTRSLTGSETAASLAYGLGQAPGDIASATAGLTLVTDTGIRTAANLPSTVSEEGAADTGEAIVNAITSTTRGGVESFSENPAETTGRVAGGFAAGAAITRGAAATRTKIRSARVRTRADAKVDLEDITSEKGVEGENPTFQTDPDADTEKAVSELETRAEDNPDAAKPGDSDGAVFHTTQSDISGSRGARNRASNAADKVTRGESTDIDVGEGASELPGLFTSPDASPLGLSMGSQSSFGVALKRPRLRGGKSDQVVSLPGDDVRGMPARAQGAGYELRRPDGSVKESGLGRGEAKSRAEGTDLEVRPDSSTAGYKFLTEDADAGTIYARPSGSRTPELEGIAPPGSQYVEEGITAVRMPGRSINVRGRDIGIPSTGRTIPMRRFKRADSDSDSDGTTTRDSDGETTTNPDADTDPVEAYQVPSSRRRDVTPGQQSAAGGYLGSGITTVSGSGSATTTGTTGTTSDGPTSTTDPTTGTDPTTPTNPNTPTSFDGYSTGFSGITTGSSGLSIGSPTGSPFGSGTSTGGGPSSSGTGGSPPGASSTSGGGGSGDGGSTYGGGGSTPPGTPTPPDTPPRNFDLPGGDNKDDDEFSTRLDGTKGEIITNFRNPLTGDVLETDPNADL